ncbi:hypothetical protein LINPERHAP1_LOCUS14380 [Linum perenne]
MHKEVTSPSHDRHISSLVHQRISPHKVNRTMVMCAVKTERETQPSSESVLSVVHIHPLRPTYRWRVQVVVKGDWVVENGYVPEMKLASQDGLVGTLGRCHDGCGGIGLVAAVVDDVMEEECHLLAWLVLLPLGEVTVG